MRRVLLIATLTMLWAFTGGCYVLVTPPPRECPIENLTLDEEPFPPGAIAGKILSPLPGAPIPRTSLESAGRTINYEYKGGANHDIYRYKSEGRAAQEFKRRKELEFSTRQWRGPWEIPNTLKYRSPIANRYYVACGMQNNVYMCKMIAQYEEYFVLFSADMLPAAMTFEDLEHVLRAIDERMAQCLKKPLPPTYDRS